MTNFPGYKIFALGDSALTIDFGNVIDVKLNDTVISFFKQIQNHPIDGITEIVPAYSSITFFYNIIELRKKIPEEQTVFDWMQNMLQEFLKQERKDQASEKEIINIPVCYENEFATDINFIAEQNKISPEEIIQLHTAKTYRVFMLGFLPGFSYMGLVDDRIAIARKPAPQNVEAGSVGIAGKQTGIYPLNSPGGWQIIGRTPLKIFDKKKDPPVVVKAGSIIKFYSINKDEFESIKSRNT